jgi:hypothetical protein
MLYAVLLAFFIRIMDEPLVMQPDNPFLISMHAAALPHIVGIPRGDMAVMFAETAECLLFALLLGILCRLIFGTKPRQLHTLNSGARWPAGYRTA